MLSSLPGIKFCAQAKISSALPITNRRNGDQECGGTLEGFGSVRITTCVRLLFPSKGGLQIGYEGAAELPRKGNFPRTGILNLA